MFENRGGTHTHIVFNLDRHINQKEEHIDMFTRKHCKHTFQVHKRVRVDVDECVWHHCRSLASKLPFFAQSKQTTQSISHEVRKSKIVFYAGW